MPPTTQQPSLSTTLGNRGGLALLPPPATAYALIGAAHAHNKRVHAKERTRLSDPSYKTRHPLDPSSRIHGELVESTRERGRGWRREFYTILALPHARSPSTPRHGPLLVNELSKHRVFVVRTNRWTLLMRGTEEEREGEQRELQRQHLIFCFLLGILAFCLPRILFMCICIYI